MHFKIAMMQVYMTVFLGCNFTGVKLD